MTEEKPVDIPRRMKAIRAEMVRVMASQGAKTPITQRSPKTKCKNKRK